MKQIKHITRTRILSVLMIAMVIILAGVLSYVAAIEEQMADKHLKYILYLDKFTHTSNRLTQQAGSFLITEDIKYFDNFWYEVNTVKSRETSILELKALGLTKEEEQMIDDLVAISNEQKTLEGQVMMYVMNGESKKAKDIIISKEYSDKIVEVERITQEFNESIQNRITKRIDKLTAVISGMTILAYGVILGTSALQIYLNWFVQKDLIRPVKKFCKEIQEFAQGNLQVKMDFKITDTEVGEVAKALLEFQKYQRNLVEDIDYLLTSMAEQNFSAKSRCRESYKGDYANILTTMENVSHTLEMTLKEIQEKNALLTSIYDAVPAGIIRLIRKDGVFRLLSMNHASMAFFNSLNEDVYAKDWSTGIAGNIVPEDAPILAQAYEQLTRPGDVVTIEYRGLRSDGSICYINGNIMMVSETEEGQIIQRLVYDITEQVRLKQRIASEREMYRIAMESNSDAMYEYFPEQDVFTFYWSKKFLIDGGIQNEEYMTKQTFEQFSDVLIQGKIAYSEDVPKVMKNICEAHCESFDGRFKQAGTNDFLWCHVSGKPIRKDGKLLRIVGTFHNIHEEKVQQSKLLEEASTDSLTGLLRRNYATQLIERYFERKEQAGYGFLIIDLDNFKHINDTYGHRMGDTVLQTVAKVITNTFRSTDICARLGGDEMIIFVPNIMSVDLLERRIARMVEQFRRELEILNVTGTSGISVGCVFSKEKMEFEVMYNQADELLYWVKENQKGGWKIKVCE